LVFAVLAAVAWVTVRIGYEYRITGFGRYEVDGKVHPFKTFWDWLKLLIVPAVLALDVCCVDTR